MGVQGSDVAILRELSALLYLLSLGFPGYCDALMIWIPSMDTSSHLTFRWELLWDRSDMFDLRFVIFRRPAYCTLLSRRSWAST